MPSGFVDKAGCRRAEATIQLARELELAKPVLKMLDVGCGSRGLTEAIMKAVDAKEVYGLDINIEALVEAESKGIRCLPLDIEDQQIPLPDNQFDFVTMIEVLEHLTNPLNSLLEIHRVLRPRGLFLTSTPNLGSWRNRITFLFGKYPEGLALIPGKLRIGGGTLLENDPGHVRLYTLGALKLLLGYSGFDIVKVVGISSNFLNISRKHRLFTLLAPFDSLLATVPGLAWHLAVVARKVDLVRLSTGGKVLE